MQRTIMHKDKPLIFETLDAANGLTIGDHIEKKTGKTYLRGRLLTIYRMPEDDSLWGVILIDKSEASGHLQHLYPLAMFSKYL